MKQSPRTAFLNLAAGLALAALLASCQTPMYADPAFQAVKDSIPDTDYPAAEIVGQWLAVSADKDRIHESKAYMELRPDGTGLRRIIHSVKGVRISENTAHYRWSYLAQNRWSIALVPGSIRTQYVAPGFYIDPKGNAWKTCVYRLLPPRLCDVTQGVTWVPLDNLDLVRAKHREQR